MNAERDHKDFEIPAFGDIPALSPRLQLRLAIRSAQRIEDVFKASTEAVEGEQCAAVSAGLALAAAVANGREHNADLLKEARDGSKKVSRELGKRSSEDGHPSRRSSAAITYAIRAAVEYLQQDARLADTVKNTLRGAVGVARVATWMVHAIERDSTLPEWGAF